MAGKSKKELIPEMIYRKLRSDIIKGRLKPGARLVELDLADQYGASQIPVREAIKRLEEQGLLTMIKHTGTFVSDISFQEMQELFQHRVIIEKHALAKAMYVMSVEERNRLQAIYEGMICAAEENNLERLIDLDMEFHESIIEFSGRKISLQMWRMIDGQIRRFVTITHPKYFTDLTEFALTHKPLLDSILSGEVKTAQQCSEDHIQLIWNKLRDLNNNEYM